jgi:hypothetical protein
VFYEWEIRIQYMAIIGRRGKGMKQGRGKGKREREEGKAEDI